MDCRVAVVESMPFAENTYIVWRSGRSDALVIDPGFEPEAILDRLRSEGLTAVAILNTHGHVDHIAGNDALKAAFPDAPLIIGAGDAVMLTDPMRNLSGLGGVPVTSPPEAHTLRALDFATQGATMTIAPGKIEVAGRSCDDQRTRHPRHRSGPGAIRERRTAQSSPPTNPRVGPRARACAVATPATSMPAARSSPARSKSASRKVATCSRKATTISSMPSGATWASARSSRVTADDTVYASYRYSLRRMDTVQVAADGKVSLKQGAAAHQRARAARRRSRLHRHRARLHRSPRHRDHSR